MVDKPYDIVVRLEGMVARLREVYNADKSCLLASRTSKGDVLSYDIVRRLKMGNAIPEDFNHTQQVYKPSIPNLSNDVESDIKGRSIFYWSHVNAFTHGNMSLLSRHACARAFEKKAVNQIRSVRGGEVKPYMTDSFLTWDNLCRKLMDQMSYVFGVKMYIRDHYNKSNPSTYIRIDLEDKTISDSDELPNELRGRHKDLLIHSTVVEEKYRYEYEHDVAVVW